MLVICLFYGVISLATAKKTYYCSGKQDGLHYCSYTIGDPRSNIVINAPHGGELRPKDMRKRGDAGCLVGNQCRWEHECGEMNFKYCESDHLTDYLSGDIAKQMAEDIEELTGIRPYLIVNEVQRGYLDGNREIRTATFGDPVGVRTFHEYHDFIRNATDSAKTPTLFLEMHGHTHPAEWFEVGYLLKKRALDEGTIDPKHSSIRGLYERAKHKFSFKQMIQGNKSMGYLFQKLGYRTVPSPDYPGPSRLGYYPGGFNMKVHAPLWNTQVDAVQIEYPHYIRKKENVRSLGRETAEIVLQWMKVYYEGKYDAI